MTEQAKLTAADDTGSTGFGSSVAISGHTIVIGAPAVAVGSNFGQGAVYIYRKAAGGWASGTEVARLTQSDGRANDRFGTSVAISGDTIVVGCGCPRGTPMLPAPGGAAYVFTEPAGGWASGTETAKLTPSDGVPGDAFGIAVAISEDTIVVGGSGAYVFVKPAGGWTTGTQQAKLTPSARGQGFAFSLAISGDTIVAGAQFDDLGSGRMCPCNQGSAFVFTRPASGWTSGTETAKLTASDATGDAFFGRAIAVNGDTIVVGALPFLGLSVGPGAAYVFTEPAAGWASGTETAKLTASDLVAGDVWGSSIAAGDDMIFVGGPSDDSSIADHGSVYAFAEPLAGWADATETSKLTTSDAEARGFGRSVAVSGETLVVAAGNSLGPGQREGAAYVFGAETDILAPATTITLAPPAPDGQAGWYVSTVQVRVSGADEAGGSGVADTRCVLDPSVAPATFADMPAGACAYLGAGGEVSSDGAHTLYAASIDVAGNAEAPVGAQFMIDQTAPGVTCLSTPPIFLLNQDGGLVSASVTDGGSGPSAGSVAAAADASSVGAKSVSLTGSDVAGNSTTVDCTYVVTFAFHGFYDPVNNDDVLNVVRAGRAIPLKWRILDANGIPVTDLAAVALRVEGATCEVGMTADALTETAAGGSGLQNLGDGFYQVNWLSQRSYANSCKALQLDLGESIVRTALFQFTK